MMGSRGTASLPLLLALFAAALPSILVAIFPTAVGAQGTELRTCYYFDGHTNPNNTKCPNSNTCCGPKATCLSNRLCHNPNDPEDLWVRGPCAIDPSKGGWDEDCAQICLYDEIAGRFPRVNLCADGSLCCNNNPTCCQDKKGVFLDESGNVVKARATGATTSYPPKGTSLDRFTQTPSTSTTSTSSTSASTSTSESTTTSSDPPASATTSPAADDPAPSSSSNDSIGLKVGLGLGIPLAVIITACVVYFIVRRRRSTPDPGFNGSPGTQYQPPVAPNYYHQGPPQTPMTVYSGVPKPVELGGQMASELDNGMYQYHDRAELDSDAGRR